MQPCRVLREADLAIEHALPGSLTPLGSASQGCASQGRSQNMPTVGVQEQVEAGATFLVPLEKAVRIEVRALPAMPLLQLLELRVRG